MRVLIAGASGFIGRNLVKKLPRKWEAVALYNTQSDFPDFLATLRLNNIIPLQLNLIDRNQVRDQFAKIGREFDCCVFLAGNTDIARSVPSPAYDLTANVISLLNVLDEVRVGELVLLSSGAVYEGLTGLVTPDVAVRPSLPYAISKLAQEHYVLHYHKKKVLPKYQILRFFGAYGPFEPPRKIFTRLVRAFYFGDEGTFVIRGDGRNYIDAMYVEDAVDGILRVLEHGCTNTIIDFASGTPMMVNELVIVAERLLRGKGVRIVHSGDTIEYITFWASGEKMEELFGFRPRTTLKEGLTRLATWLASHDYKNR